MKPLSDREIAQLSSWLENRQDFVFLDTSRVTEENHRSCLFLDPVKWLICGNRDQAALFFQECRELRQQGYFLAGWFSYEFGYLLEPSLYRASEKIAGPFSVLGVFKNPIIFDHHADNSGRISGLTGAQAIREEKYSISDVRTNVSELEHRQALEKIKHYLAAGDTYQVNFTLKLRFGFNGSVSSCYRALRRNQSVSYGAWIRRQGKDILSFSPELFFRADTEKVTVKPMKGTMSRGRTTAEDVSRMKALRRDAKNVSENVMIVDLLRNDLGRFLHKSGGGSVRPRSLFDVEVYETLLQMTSTIDGVPAVRGNPQFDEIVEALFPCGSVTGAPKIRTMEIIHELEKEQRGVYCGAIGFCSDREAFFNVPIRTVVLEEGKGEMGIGSGIVHDSDPEAEWEECLLKGAFLTRPAPAFQLIETLLWQPGSGYWLFREHMERLLESAAYFFFTCDRQQITGRLAEEAQSFETPRRVRLLLHRDGSMAISSSPIQQAEAPAGGQNHLRGSLPLVRFSDRRTDPKNIHLYHKTTERKLYTEERHRALAQGCFEVLFCNMDGEATEGSVTNIFIREQGRLLTPPVGSGLLAGTFRRFLLEKGDAVEQRLSREDVLAAETLYVGNSVRGLVQVRLAAEEPCTSE
ncbi:MAG: aminodeoxychorismate synthase component I [Desulfobulbaceae bacterium]|nr:aminodeoxychorismate synthase component I [Desulfobulbaceae bacterium]